jgi:hypothetical protein
LRAQHCCVTKLLIIVALAGALANGVESHKQPPLLIDSSSAPLDAGN